MAAKRILVGTDFSDQAKHAVVAVAEYARDHGSHVTLAYVIDPRAFVPPQAVVVPEANLHDKEGRKAELDALRDELLSDVDADTVVLTDHAAARAICDFAKENDFDLIAIGSQGHGRVEQWLIGSVAERVVRNAHCNVFIFRE